MGIEYIDNRHAKLVVSFGSGEQRTRRVKRITYSGKRDAERQFREFESSVNFSVDSKITVTELIDWYVSEFEANGGKATTLRGYRIAGNAVSKYFGKAKAKDITLRDIEAYIKKQRKEFSPKTIKNRISLLSSAYTAAIRRGFLAYNPCEYAVIPKQKKPTITILSEQDISKFVSALDDVELDFKVMCELALFCGLRRSELFGLHKSDASDTVTINKVRHRIHGNDIIQTPKTKTSSRVLAVPKFIQADIASLIEEQKSRPMQSKFLILNEFGEPISPNWASRRLDKITKNNNLPPVTMHGLRHTCASMLINSGIPIAEVSSQLGHASIDITLRTYTHLFQDASTASRRISDLMDSRMAPK